MTTTAIEKIEVPAKLRGITTNDYAYSVVIDSPEKLAQAISNGKYIVDAIKSLEEERLKYTAPLNQTLRRINAQFNPVKKELEKHADVLRAKVANYYKAQRESSDAKIDKLAGRVEKGTLKRETAERKMLDIQTPDKTTSAEFGTATVREKVAYRVIDKSLVPLEFMEVDMRKVEAAFKAGQTVPGCETYTDYTTAFS